VAGVLAVAAAVSSLFGGAHRATPAPGTIPQAPVALAAAFIQAQQVIDNPASPAAQLQGAGQLEQLATIVLSRGRASTRRAVLAHLSGAAAATLRAGLDAASALARLNQPRKSLPPWRIAAPPPPARLLGYLKAAQARYRVPWQYLAAIELIETDFGRVVGLSTAGAEGPMQFMPATWAAYGRGNVHNQRDAIFAAARYLAANGAPGNMADAVYHYNLSRDYVRAVRDYASRMATDARAVYGYYNTQVIVVRTRGLSILPVGFPKARPIPLVRVTGW
jgi:membrane-bound lytic murein transglycosylase B